MLRWGLMRIYTGLLVSLHCACQAIEKAVVGELGQLAAARGGSEEILVLIPGCGSSMLPVEMLSAADLNGIKLKVSQPVRQTISIPRIHCYCIILHDLGG